MTEPRIREMNARDIPALTGLWTAIFGDSESFVREYFRLLPGFGRCAVAEISGHIVGMASVITGLELIRPDAVPLRCGYIYAVAVDEAARHGGLGAELTHTACRFGMEQGAHLLCTLPAEDSLYAWYEKLMGVQCALYRRSYSVCPREGASPRRLCAEEYSLRREALLVGRAHLRLNDAAMSLAQCFYETYGGGLFSCGDGICAAYGDKERLFIKELISTPGGEGHIAAALAASLGAAHAAYFLPCESGEKYLAAAPGSVPRDCVWNMSFD